MNKTIAIRRDARPFLAGILAVVVALVATLAGAGGWVSADEAPGTTGTLPPPADNLPGAPRHIVAMAGDGEVGVAWSEPVNNGGSDITGYVIDIEPGDDDHNAPADGNLIAVISGLTNGTTYRLRVAAVNENGQGPWSHLSNPVTPREGKRLNIERLEHRQDALARLVERLRAKYQELKDRAQERLEAARERAEEQIDRAREKAQEHLDKAETNADRAIDKLREKAEKVIERAEESGRGDEVIEKTQERLEEAERKIDERLDKTQEKVEERIAKAEEKANAAIARAEERTREHIERIAERLRKIAEQAQERAGSDGDDDDEESDSEDDEEDESDDDSDDEEEDDA